MYSTDLHTVQTYVQFRRTYSTDIRTVQTYVQYRHTYSSDIRIVFIVKLSEGWDWKSNTKSKIKCSDASLMPRNIDYSKIKGSDE